MAFLQKYTLVPRGHIQYFSHTSSLFADLLPRIMAFARFNACALKAEVQKICATDARTLEAHTLSTSGFKGTWIEDRRGFSCARSNCGATGFLSQVGVN
jgi:hypothetical protein